MTTTRSPARPQGVEIEGRLARGDEQILSEAALAFLADLTRTFRPRLDELLARRAARRGTKPAFLAETAAIRAGEWRIAPVPEPLRRRVVEITGPVDRKMIVNALNSGADVFMADFEDATAPTWRNVLDGQRNVRDAVRRAIDFTDPRTGKEYRLGERVATLLVRPRGLHLPEAHLTVDGRPIPAALFDFGLHLFHNGAESVARGAGPWLYLPKLESHHEARWWNDVFVHAQRALGLPHGTIKATVLIETLPAAFEMDEILHALKDHSAGLNCGRWDYIFSFIKVHAEDPAAVLPDRAQVTMEQPFMRAYTQLLVRTCHRRGAHAMGGMAAQIPIKDDPEKGRLALEKVRADKLREVADGHDGTWVAHPGLVAIAREAFASRMTGPNQLHRLREDVHVTAADLLRVPTGTRTAAGLLQNVRVGVLYLGAWLGGLGCVPIDHLMEDAATAEISRAQLWQWLRHGARLDDGTVVTRELVRGAADAALAAIEREVGAAAFAAGRYARARALFEELCFAERLPEFLTLRAYEELVGAAAGHEA